MLLKIVFNLIYFVNVCKYFVSNKFYCRQSMKKILTFFYFVISLHTVLAQIPQEDSLIKILSLTKVDSVKVKALVRLSSFNQSSQQGLAAPWFVLSWSQATEMGQAIAESYCHEF